MSDEVTCSAGESGGDPRHPDRALVGWVVAGALAAALARPAFTLVARGVARKRPLYPEPWIESLRWIAVEGVVATGVFVLGATLGSFLNVVVHRLPSGRSPLSGRSHCPACGHQIRPHDNIPVLGWLRLGGRCRDCRVPISPRYPIVEAVCGGLLLLVWECEWVSGGANLPGRSLLHRAPLDWLVLQPRSDLGALFAFHAAVLLVMLVWALVASDGYRLPARHFAVVLGLAVLLPAVWPWLHPLGLVARSAAQPAGIATGLASALVGLAVGGCLGGLAARSGGGWGPMACLALWGAACGWQAALATALLFGVMMLADRTVARLTSWLPLPAPWLMVAAAVVHLVAWRPLHGALFAPGGVTSS